MVEPVFQYPPPDRISCNPHEHPIDVRTVRPFSIHHRIELAATELQRRHWHIHPKPFSIHHRIELAATAASNAVLAAGLAFQYPPPDRISCNWRNSRSRVSARSAFSIHHRIELAATKHRASQDARFYFFQYPPPDRISCNLRTRRERAYLANLSVSTTGSN